MRRMAQKYVCVSTVRIEKECLNGAKIRCVMINFVVEEQSRKVHTMCIRREEVATEDMNVGEVEVDIGRTDTGSRSMKTTFMCSLHSSWGASGLVDSDCWHIDCIKRDMNFMARIVNILESGFRMDNRNSFGDLLHVTEGASGMTVAHSGSGSRQVDVEVSENGVIPIHLDDLKKEDLRRKEGSVSKRWSS